MLQLRVFGGVSIEGPDGPLSGAAAQRHRRALLALLAAAYPKDVPRDKLLAYLWPERDTASARNLLNQAVHAVRRAAGEGAVVSSGEGLRLDVELLPCDIVAFEEALAAEAPERAVELYAGPFLDGFSLPGAREFERWAEDERLRLARSRSAALEALAEAAESRGDFIEAVRWWRKVVADDPLSSRVTLRLMQALAGAGNPAGALEVARIHEQLLDEEFGAKPDPSVIELAERLRTDPPPPASLPVGPGVAPSGSAVAPPGSSSPPSGEAGDARHPHTPGPVQVRAPDLEASSGRPVRRRGAVLAAGGGLGLAALLLLFAAWPGPEGPSAADPDLPVTVAVLPFTDMSDGENLYLADGVTEEILLHLAAVPDLRVISRTSVMRYRDAEEGLREIGRELGATHVLEGSVRRDEDRVRVTAQLIDAGTDHHLWADSYDRDLEDIFAIQTDISMEIVAALSSALPGEAPEPLPPSASLPAAPTDDLEAYQLYLQGRYLLHNYIRLAPEAPLPQAKDYFRAALERDPSFARAWAAKAATHALLLFTMYHPSVDFDETAAAALAAVDAALAIDSTLAEAFSARAQVHTALLRWADAEDDLRRAIALEPENAQSHLFYGMLLVAAGRTGEATEVLLRANERDPLNGLIGHWLADALRNGGDLEGARAEAERGVALGMASSGIGVYIHHVLRGEWEEAVAAQEQVVEMHGGDPGWVRPVVEAVRDPDRISAAEEALAPAAREDQRVAPLWFYFDMEAPDLVFDELLDMVEEGRPTSALWRMWEPQLTELRNHPRFHDVATRAGLVDFWRERGWPDLCEPEGVGFVCR